MTEAQESIRLVRELGTLTASRLGLQMGGDDPQAQPTNQMNKLFILHNKKQTNRGRNQNGTVPTPYPKQTTPYPHLLNNQQYTHQSYLSLSL